jgi:hypothetical protein
MKKISLLLLPLIAFTAFAETQSVECGTNPAFGTNSCEVCYTDTFEATEANDGWVSNITNVKIPWKHNGGEKAEIIYDNEQKFPEIKTTLKFTTKPEKKEDLWINHESLVWTPFSDHKEVFVQEGEEIGLYKLADKAGITVQWKKPDDTILFHTPLVVRDFDVETNEDSDAKTRNICVLGKFTVKKNVVVTPVTPIPPTTLPVPQTPPVVEETVTTETALESAPEEPVTTTETTTTETTAEPEVLESAGTEEVVATADQTKTQTGPALWICLLLAFVLSSAWSAWKKQNG